MRHHELVHYDDPEYLLEDPRLRLKIGTRIYRAHATKVEDPDVVVQLRHSMMEKYAVMEGFPSLDGKGDIWFFRVSPD